MSLTKVALVTLLIIIILAIGQPLSTVHQRRCYSCRWTFWKQFFWNNVNLETGLVVHLGIAATNLWLTIIRVRWIKQFSKLSKNYRMECTRWLKNRAHQAGALSKRKGRIQRFVLYSPHFNVKMAQVSEFEIFKCFKQRSRSRWRPIEAALWENQATRRRDARRWNLFIYRWKWNESCDENNRSHEVYIS